MNKKSQRNTFQAPTTQPVVAIAPSGTVTLDGELPQSASNGVTAPEPLAAHDVLHAAMAHPDTSSTTAPDNEPGTTAVNDPAVNDSSIAADSSDVKPAKENAKKAARKKRQSADVVPASTPADPLAAAIAPKAKPAKEKFVACDFTLSQSEAALLSAMKKTHQANGINVKKSQLLRAALLHLADVDSAQLAHLVAQLPQPPVARNKKK